MRADVLMGCGCLLLNSNAQAMQQEQMDDIEVIQVTAQKRLQNVQDVGISSTVITSKHIERTNLSETTDIVQQVPNLQLNEWSPNLTIFNIRGISQNNFTDNLEGPIAVYHDNAYLGNLNGLSGPLYDVKRVEVLRGPQGTLFGRNATGGVIQFIHHDATLGELNGYGRIGAGKYNQLLFEGALGGSINDSLRYRVASRVESADGYIESQTEGVRDVGGKDVAAIRFSLQAELFENWLADLTISYSKDDDVPTGGYAFLPWSDDNIAQGYLPPELVDFTHNVILSGEAPPNDLTLNDFTRVVFFNQEDGFTPVDESGRTIFTGDPIEPHQHFSNTNGFLERETFTGQLLLTAELDSGLGFKSITSLIELDKNYLEDGDGIRAPIIEFNTKLDYQQLGQECHLYSGNDKHDWLVGSYYLDTDHDGQIITIGNPVLRLANQLVTQGILPSNYDASSGSPQAVQMYQISATNIALFGHYEYRLTPEWALIAGIRWSRDEKQLDYRRGFQDRAANIPFLIQASVNSNQDIGKIDYQGIASKLQVNWQASDSLLWFASYKRGIKVGNWAFTASLPLENMKHGDETLNAFEIGIKSQFSSRSTLNMSAFYYDYEDYQAFAMVGLAPQISNSDATLTGAELEYRWESTDGYWFQLGYSVLNSNVEEVKGVASWQSPVGGTLIDFPVDVLTDLDMPNAPDFNVNYQMGVEFETSLGELVASLDGVYYDDQYLEVTNAGGSFQKAYGLVNLNLGWQYNNWHFSVWGKNVTDEVYKQYNLDLGMLGATSFYGKPRHYGISLKYQF